MKNDPIALIKQKLTDCHRLAITSHLRPDGDSLCTSLALYYMGKLLDKEVSIYIKDRVPFPFNHFPDIDRIQIGQIPADKFDCVFLLECANVSRSGQDNLENYFKVNIDHHYSNDYYADINWVDPEAAAVACMIFRLGEELDIRITPQIATQLYSAIVSDTGSFQFSNTTAEAFEICHKLVNYGAVPIQVSEFLFNNNPPEKIKLLGLVLSTLQMNPEGNIAIITMSKQNREELNLNEVDTEDITTLARSIKGAKMVLFFKEIEPGTYRVSIRSKASANSALVAEHFGGGGHQHAAGFTVSGEYQKLLKEVPEVVNRLISE
jgi:phosphoesterase RecJ-like protein